MGGMGGVWGGGGVGWGAVPGDRPGVIIECRVSRANECVSESLSLSLSLCVCVSVFVCL